ncbi:sensor histidine kinase [Allopontixanthobacter sp.]|uniref:sensor histidine kinase n=1 Tax=Allopontixanthobacter sp. TaxID=2906452 RepID=UPI002AB8C8B4|nr:histidine kinase dimerization/phospho-acceptor domain-containing protein [Allopontixanthobacter sp.]MDZ4307122.1 histidine kinase dimerization/phospho-acceptor domain-containing protein [Allopontixanthobacter sp.]
MLFDDRLATVLRHRATGERAARTQFRQLLDLLGSRSTVHAPGEPSARRDQQLLASAWLRLGALGELLPASERAAMIRDPGLRFRNPDLALHLAEDEPEVAVAALARADLSDAEWQDLIPRLPVRARGFLRLRRDMPPSTARLLDRLGIHDRGLPTPPPASVIDAAVPPEAQPAPASAPISGTEGSEIGALVKRIEAFRSSRRTQRASGSSPLPSSDERGQDLPRLSGFAFTSDAEGRIDWAEASVAPMMVGKRLGDEGITPIAFARHQPLRNYSIILEGAPLIEGRWVVDATPRFTVPGGRFYGYAGKFRRPAVTASGGTTQSASSRESEADRLRQLLHELRTPVNAIQGFSEIIQQQLFGTTPHEYRALAAAIAGDSARILAGFEELDRLARLEAGALEMEEGTADLRAMVERTCTQLQDVLRPRTSSFELAADDRPCRIAMSERECEALGWRLLATLASVTGAGELVHVTLDQGAGMARLACELPISLSESDDIFAASTRPSGGSLSAGVFGTGFSLRLVRAETRAAGGDLVRMDNWIMLQLPLSNGEANGSASNADTA